MELGRKKGGDVSVHDPEAIQTKEELQNQYQRDAEVDLVQEDYLRGPSEKGAEEEVDQEVGDEDEDESEGAKGFQKVQCAGLPEESPLGIGILSGTRIRGGDLSVLGLWQRGGWRPCGGEERFPAGDQIQNRASSPQIVHSCEIVIVELMNLEGLSSIGQRESEQCTNLNKRDDDVLQLLRGMIEAKFHQREE